MATFLSDAIKLVTALLMTFGLSAFLVVSAHESHDDRADLLQLTQDAAAHEAVREHRDDNTASPTELVHGHSHDGFSHDHTSDFLDEHASEITRIVLTGAVNDCAPSVQRPPVYEIVIPPRG